MSASLLYSAPISGNGNSTGILGRGQAEGWGGSRGCSLQSPQAEPETPRAEKDRGVLRAWDIYRTRSPLESRACACGCLFQRYCRGGGKPYLQSSSSLVHCSLNYCCFSMSSLPSEYKIFLYEMSRSLQLTVTPIVFPTLYQPLAYTWGLEIKIIALATDAKEFWAHQ